MNDRTLRRTERALTQSAAAAAAGVSLATWRRWEEDPSSVRVSTRTTCEAVLAEDNLVRELTRSADKFDAAWRKDPNLTPRQAYAIALTLDMWADSDLEGWLQNPISEPLHRVGPFAYLDKRVMFLIGESRAFADAVRDRCRRLSEELENGSVPFQHPGPYIDELLVGATLPMAQSYLDDMPDVFERINPRNASARDDEPLTGDDDWDFVSDAFDDMSQWDEWEVPLMHGHTALPAILTARHPFTWFDDVEPTGPGYLMSLRTGA